MNEPQPQPEAATKNFFTTVTPFSKYLALALFVALPFVGGYVGYNYAPEKVVEVERVVEKLETVEEVSDTKSNDQSIIETFNKDSYLDKQFSIGDTFDDWTIVSTSSNDYVVRKVHFNRKEPLSGIAQPICDIQSGQTYFTFTPDEGSALPNVSVNIVAPIVFDGSQINIFPPDGFIENTLEVSTKEDCGAAQFQNDQIKSNFEKEYSVELVPKQLNRIYYNVGNAATDSLWVDQIEIIR